MNLERLTRPNVRDLKPYSSARDEFDGLGMANMVMLDANENPIDNGINRYPDPHHRALKSELSALYQLDAANILVGNGSDEVLDLLFRAFCEPGVDNVISLQPSYGMYKVLAGINNVENKEVLLDAGFQPNVEPILAAQDAHSKLLFLCSPNNPTANLFDSGKVTQLLEDFQGIVVIDEAYIHFAKSKSWIGRIQDHQNLVVTQTLSKAYGMAGLRLGLCFANPKIIEVLTRIKPPYNVNQLTLERALTGIKDQEKLRNDSAVLIAEREKLMKSLSEMKSITEVFKSDANFILARIKNDAKKLYQELINNGIVVRDRSNLPLCENCLRFTVGTPEENLKLINALNQIDHG